MKLFLALALCSAVACVDVQENPNAPSQVWKKIGDHAVYFEFEGVRCFHDFTMNGIACVPYNHPQESK